MSILSGPLKGPQVPSDDIAMEDDVGAEDCVPLVDLGMMGLDVVVAMLWDVVVPVPIVAELIGVAIERPYTSVKEQ
jgi:hypothetical protein